MAGHTAAYDEFLFSFNGGLEFKDDLDLDAYGRATSVERAELDRILEQKLPEGISAWHARSERSGRRRKRRRF